MKKVKIVFQIISAVAFVFTLNSCTTEKKTEEHNHADMKLPEVLKVNEAESSAKLSSELVCMVNDAFMGKKQFPVPFEDKMYYGCCEMCVDRLKNNKKLRYATDPLTGKEVDKAKAFIVLKDSNTGAVWYFESESNYNKYFEQNKL